MTLEGNPWFVAKDVCKVLGFTVNTLKYHLKVNIGKDEGKVVKLPTPGGIQGITCLSESGLYKLIMRSDKPQAKAFQDWVTKEVLPSIRKTGSFVTGQPSLVENPQMSALELAYSQRSATIFAMSPKIDPDNGGQSSE